MATFELNEMEVVKATVDGYIVRATVFLKTEEFVELVKREQVKE